METKYNDTISRYVRREAKHSDLVFVRVRTARNKLTHYIRLLTARSNEYHVLRSLQQSARPSSTLLRFVRGLKSEKIIFKTDIR